MVAGVAAFCVVDGRTGRALYEADFGEHAKGTGAFFLFLFFFVFVFFSSFLFVCAFSPRWER